MDDWTVYIIVWWAKWDRVGEMCVRYLSTGYV